MSMADYTEPMLAMASGSDGMPFLPSLPSGGQIVEIAPGLYLVITPTETYYVDEKGNRINP